MYNISICALFQHGQVFLLLFLSWAHHFKFYFTVMLLFFSLLILVFLSCAAASSNCVSWWISTILPPVSSSFHCLSAQNSCFTVAQSVVSWVSFDFSSTSVYYVIFHFMVVFSVLYVVLVELIPGYSVLYRIPEGDTSKTKIYDREMSYGQTVKPSQTTHNVSH